MRKAGMLDEEIKSYRFYSPVLYRKCIDRCVPPPKIFYWRMRAVYSLYGNMKDSKTKDPLFNGNAWKKATNVLKEISDIFYSDPPGVQWYTQRLKKSGTVMKNKYSMEMIDYARGPNCTEAYHKNLVTTFGSCNVGVEMSVCLLAERQHHHNHKCSERQRCGFPRIGHFDTWEIDELQSLVYKTMASSFIRIGQMLVSTKQLMIGLILLLCKMLMFMRRWWKGAKKLKCQNYLEISNNYVLSWKWTCHSCHSPMTKRSWNSFSMQGTM